MKRWLFLLGGPLIWAAHFLAIYLVTSAGYVVTGSGANTVTRIAVVALSVAAIATATLLAANATHHRGPEGAFWRTIAVAGAVLAIIAIVWQTLPVLAPIEGTAPPRSS